MKPRMTVVPLRSSVPPRAASRLAGAALQMIVPHKPVGQSPMRMIAVWRWFIHSPVIFAGALALPCANIKSMRGIIAAALRGL